MLLVVAVLSSLLLGEKLYLGSALGAVLIVVGLYAVLWGKGREADNEVTTKVSELPLPIVTTDDDDGTRGATVDVVVVQQAKTSDHDSSKQQQRTTTTTR
jgi:hypothetical protein